LDLIPVREINKIVLEYIQTDLEVRAAFDYLLTTTVVKDLMTNFQVIPEVINFMNYLQNESSIFTF